MVKVQARCRNCDEPVEFFGDLCEDCGFDDHGAVMSITAADIARMNEQRDLADGVY